MKFNIKRRFMDLYQELILKARNMKIKKYICMESQKPDFSRKVDISIVDIIKIIIHKIS